MKAVIEVNVPDYQIGQEVSIYFKDTMMIKGIVQEPKTGHWFAWKLEDDVWRTTCSECGEETRTLWNYCPHCGADMRGDAE